MKDIGKTLSVLFEANDILKKNKGIGLEQQVGDYLREQLPNMGNLQKRYSNDLRHQYGSAIMAQRYGNEVAKNLGDMNEWIDYGLSGRDDTQRDLRANGIGRGYGVKYPNATNRELLDMMFKQMYYGG